MPGSPLGATSRDASDDARELRVTSHDSRATARPRASGRQRARAVRATWRRTEHDHVAELPRSQGSLQRIRHALTVRVPEPREAEEGLDHVQKPLARCEPPRRTRDVAVARIPPVVPYAGLDDGASHLDEECWSVPSRFTVSSPSSTVNCSTRAGWRCSPITRAPTSAVSSAVPRPARDVPRTLEDRGTFPGDGVLPDLADSYRCAIRWAVRVGVRHVNEFHQNLLVIDILMSLSSVCRSSLRPA